MKKHIFSSNYLEKTFFQKIVLWHLTYCVSIYILSCIFRYLPYKKNLFWLLSKTLIIFIHEYRRNLCESDNEYMIRNCTIILLIIVNPDV